MFRNKTKKHLTPLWKDLIRSSTLPSPLIYAFHDALVVNMSVDDERLKCSFDVRPSNEDKPFTEKDVYHCDGTNKDGVVWEVEINIVPRINTDA